MLTGGKSANLSRLSSTCRIPAGFCLTSPAYARWSDSVIQLLREDCQTCWPEDWVAVVRDAYADLVQRCQTDSPVMAVRSSGVDEDGSESSFAGQFLSCLNVRGFDGLLKAIARCWASTEDPRVLEYRTQQGLGAAGIAVLVQQMVAADAAAVVFSRNPTGASDDVMINANYGIGESIVSGTSSPDTWSVKRADLSLAELVIGQKATMTVCDEAAGTRDVPVLRTLRQRACLQLDQVESLAQLALKLEAEMGWPVDLECAFRGHDLYVLQCRPITATCGDRIN
ncbi:MAG: PEP/pyruvate-binding domain-containing protein [Cyanobium sp.]|jgi:phosphoenolpyruvate synthase/pyruvate phosphate dikinase